MIARILFCAGVCALTAYPDLLIRNVTIVDVATGSTIPKRSILIRGNRIVDVGTQITVRNQVQVIDGTGKFAIPSLEPINAQASVRGSRTTPNRDLNQSQAASRKRSRP